MARDSGRYDAITQTWIDQQVQIDFAWGNVPIQPNDDRGVNVLDPVLDSHEITYLGWNGFPEFAPNTTGSGASGGSGSGGGVTYVQVPQVPMPSTFAQYAADLAAVGLVAVLGNEVPNNNNSGFNGQVTNPQPAPGTSVAVGSSVTVDVMGTYVAPPVLGPTTDWVFDGMSSQWRFPETALPSILTAAPAASYKLVMTGGSFAGEYIVTQAGTDMMFMTERVITATRPNTGSGYYRGAGLADNPMYSSGWMEDAGTVSIVAYEAPALLGTNRTTWYFQSGSLYIKDLYSLPTELDTYNKGAHLLVITGGQLDGVYPLSNANVEYYNMASAVRVYANTTNTSSGISWGTVMNQLKGSSYVDNMGMMTADAGVVKFVLLEEVAMPNLLGMSGAQALAALEALGIVASPQSTIVGTTSGNVGTVASQTYSIGQMVYKGSSAKYYIYANSLTWDLEPGFAQLQWNGDPRLRLGNGNNTSTSSPLYLAAGASGLSGCTLVFNDIVITDMMGSPISGNFLNGTHTITSSFTEQMMTPDVIINIAGLTLPNNNDYYNITSGTMTITAAG